MNFRRDGLQRVVFDDGSTVEFAGREELQYVYPDARVVRITIGDDIPVTVYADMFRGPDHPLPVGSPEHTRILGIVRTALDALNLGMRLDDGSHEDRPVRGDAPRTRRYAFLLNDEARAFCDQIVDSLVARFGIDEQEALGRVNRQWTAFDFQTEDVRYHETADFWASDIYYGADSVWWTSPAGLKPLPYP